MGWDGIGWGEHHDDLSSACNNRSLARALSLTSTAGVTESTTRCRATSDRYSCTLAAVTGSCAPPGRSSYLLLLILGE